MRRATVIPFLLLFGWNMAQPIPAEATEIETMTVEHARGLVGQKQYSLILIGLTTLSAEVAKELAKHEGILYLNGPDDALAGGGRGVGAAQRVAGPQRPDHAL